MLGIVWRSLRNSDNAIECSSGTVQASEVEAALVSHPGIAAAAVVGLPVANAGDSRVGCLLALEPGWEWADMAHAFRADSTGNSTRRQGREERSGTPKGPSSPLSGCGLNLPGL
mmetsp:Transcript_33634/g.95113  ORF Transcript_33634/g.95113 Transcript_33634/m.95113 type:complete len:114 (-) Transcript_33634:4053-4394(-)